MELVLVRHGEPDTTLEDLTDPPLTERGSYVTEADFEGMSRDDAIAALHAMQTPEFQARVAAGFDDIIGAHPRATVAVVCHGGVIASLSSAVLDTSADLMVDHASVTRVMASSSGVRSLMTFNERTWLDHLRPT